MRWVPVAVIVIATAGCGGGSTPRLGRADAAQLIALTQRIARESACAQSRDIPVLRRRAIALVNAHRVPAALEEPLLGGVQSLASEQPVCLPSVPVAKTTPPKPVLARTPPHPHPHPHPHPPHPPQPHPPHPHGHGP
jgi:hypothetical protein